MRSPPEVLWSPGKVAILSTVPHANHYDFTITLKAVAQNIPSRAEGYEEVAKPGWIVDGFPGLWKRFEDFSRLNNLKASSSRRFRTFGS
jgi:hypothetical protein